MSRQPLRVFQNLDFNQVRDQLLIYGDLSGQCAKCQQIDLKLNDPKCTSCGTEFKFIAFRNVKTNMPKLEKTFAQRPSMTIVDFDDFKRVQGLIKAREFLK